MIGNYGPQHLRLHSLIMQMVNNVAQATPDVARQVEYILDAAKALERALPALRQELESGKYERGQLPPKRVPKKTRPI